MNRLIHLLFRQPGSLQVGEIVALTFTNKAAREIHLRLRSRLLAFRELADNSSWRIDDHYMVAEKEQLRDLVSRYKLTNKQVRALATRALKELERSHIGTIHSYAGHLLRLYPVQAGIDPSFIEDDGTRFATHFEKQWADWLEGELGSQGPHHDVWRRLLQKIEMKDIKELTFVLADELIPLENDGEQLRGNWISEPVKAVVSPFGQYGSGPLANLYDLSCVGRYASRGGQPSSFFKER